jgi:RNase P subunit RPR2
MKARILHGVNKKAVVCNKNKSADYSWLTTDVDKKVTCKRCRRSLSKGIQIELRLDNGTTPNG